MFSRKQLEVCLHLLVQARISATTEDEVEQAQDRDAQRRHGSFLSMRLTMATVRTQLLVSFANCLRPARVML